MSCAVPSCRSIRRLMEDRSMSFHRFPQGELQASWVETLQLQNFKWSKNKLVCSRHFSQSDYDQSGLDGRRILKKGAVPSLNLGDISEGKTSADTMVSPKSSVVPSGNLGGIKLKKEDLFPRSNQAGFARIRISKQGDLFPNRGVLGKMSKVEPSVDTKLSSGSSVLSVPSSKLQTTSSTTSGSIMKELPAKINERKRRTNDDQVCSSSACLSSGAKGRHAKVIKLMHRYSAAPSSVLKQKSKIMQNRFKKMSDAMHKINKSEVTVTSMNEVIKFLKNGTYLSQDALEHINNSVESVPRLSMARYLRDVQSKSMTPEIYPAPLWNFAATLQFYSSKAYEDVRSTFALALPSQATIRKWFTNIVCRPGYIDTSFKLLENMCSDAAKDNSAVICSLMLEEMSLKKHIESDGNKTWGYVDIGVQIENDQQIAGNVLMLMVVAVNSQWKLPIAYFFLKSTSTQEQANIVNESLLRLNQVGVIITSLTSDGPSGHLALFNALGCDFADHLNLKAYFLHQETCEKIFVVFDPCHMLKLARNVLCQLKEFKDPGGRMVRWKYLEKLHELQHQETLTLRNKSRASHVKWQSHRMKVALAEQTIDRNIADAIKFLRVDLKHPDFLESEATEDYIFEIDALFDLLNSKNPYAKGLKAPLKESNEHTWKSILLATKDYLLGCTEAETGRPLHMTERKTMFLGFAITIEGTMGIFDEFVKSKRLNYLLTHKFSQDHFETLSCCIRSMNKWMNNPTALQCSHAFRRLLLHPTDAREGNYRVLDSTMVLTLPGTIRKNDVTIDMSVMRRYNLDAADAIVQDHEYNCTSEYISLDEPIANVVTYLAGFVIKMLEKRKMCVECISEGVVSFSSENFLLNRWKNREGLRAPSPALLSICQETERTLRILMDLTDFRIPNDDEYQRAFVLSISQRLFSKVYTIFPTLESHFLDDVAALEEHHGFILIKAIVYCYTRIRFFNIQKKYTVKIDRDFSTKKYAKLLLLSNE